MPRTESPLRYPGGKSKLYNTIKKLINDNFNKSECTYIEPFAGGAGLALKLLNNGDVERIVLNDIDEGIYSFWIACLLHTNELCNLIQECEISIDNWNIQRNIYRMKSGYTKLEIGFATFFLNRCNVSGVIQGGPIGGKTQNGKYSIDARFNKNDLISKIQAIGAQRDRIEIFNLDATNFLLNVVPNYTCNKVLLNIDPPYVKKGPMLYENSFTEEDHVQLSNIIKMLDTKWIVTYDENQLIYDIYEEYRKNVISMNYSAGQTKKGQELIIYSHEVIKE